MTTHDFLQGAIYADRDLSRAEFERRWNAAYRDEHSGGTASRIIYGVLAVFTIIAFTVILLANYS